MYHGVFAENGAHENTIGGTVSAARNVILGTVAVELNGSDHNTISANYIGVKADNSGAFGGTFGVADFGSFNTIGGTTAGQRTSSPGSASTASTPTARRR